MLSTVRQPAGKYRLLEDPLLPEKETQRRIDSFTFFLHPPMTVKEDTSDRLTATTEQIPTTRQQEETILSPNLTTDHRRSRKNQTPNQDWHILCLGFRTPGKLGPFASRRDSLESRSLSSESSRFHGSIADSGCITLNTSTR